MVTALVAGALLSAAAPAAAHAAATPVSPGYTNIGPNSHPTFQWTLPSNERSSLLSVARAPAITPEGRFFSENIETSKALDPGQTQYTAEQPLTAGTHWWIVRTFQTSPFREYVTTPVPFFISPVIARPRVRITRYRFTRKLGVEVRLSGNVSSARLRVAAYRGRKRVGRGSQLVRYLGVGREATRFVLVRIRGRRARRLKVVVSVSALGAKSTKRRRVRGV